MCRWIGDVKARLDVVNAALVSLQAAVQDVQDIAEPATGETPPVDPPDGKYWFSTSTTPAKLYVFANAEWIPVGPEE